MTLSSVVLPAPLGPMMARISPRWMLRLTPLSASSAPKRTLTPSTASSGHAVAVAVEGLDEGRVLLADGTAAHLARPRDLLVVGVELLVQDQELADLRPLEHLVVQQAAIDALDFLLDQL